LVEQLSAVSYFKHFLVNVFKTLCLKYTVHFLYFKKKIQIPSQTANLPCGARIPATLLPNDLGQVVHTRAFTKQYKLVPV